MLKNLFNFKRKPKTIPQGLEKAWSENLISEEEFLQVRLQRAKTALEDYANNKGLKLKIVDAEKKAGRPRKKR